MEKIAVRTKEAAKMIGMSEIWLKKDRRKENSVGPPWIRKGRAILYPVAGLKGWAKEEA